MSDVRRNQHGLAAHSGAVETAAKGAHLESECLQYDHNRRIALQFYACTKPHIARQPASAHLFERLVWKAYFAWLGGLHHLVTPIPPSPAADPSTDTQQHG
jgi:hypothetical protein